MTGYRQGSGTEKQTALVTGANKGIGYEIAADLGALGWTVGVGARDDGRREAAVDSCERPGWTRSAYRWTSPTTPASLLLHD